MYRFLSFLPPNRSLKQWNCAARVSYGMFFTVPVTLVANFPLLLWHLLALVISSPWYEFLSPLLPWSDKLISMNYECIPFRVFKSVNGTRPQDMQFQPCSVCSAKSSLTTSLQGFTFQTPLRCLLLPDMSSRMKMISKGDREKDGLMGGREDCI